MDSNSTTRRLVPAGSVSLEQPFAGSDQVLVVSWLASYGKATTRSSYKRAAMLLLQHLNVSLAQATTLDLQVWQHWLLTDREMAPGTVNLYCAAVKQLYGYARAQSYLANDPCRGFQRLDPVRALHERILSRTEISALLRALPRSEQSLLLRVLYMTGMRASELVTRRWQDFTLLEDGGRVLHIVGKGSRERSIRLPDKLWASINDLPRTNDRPWPITRQRINQLVQRAAKIAGLDKPVSPHWLRHSCASHLLASGWSVADVRDYLGHSSLATTSLYLHAMGGRAADELA